MLLGEGDVVDPVRVCLGLGAEAGRALRLSVGLRGGVDDGRVVADEVAVEVPGADYTIATSRVAVSSAVSMGPRGVVAHGATGEGCDGRGRGLSQNGIVAIDGEAIDAEAMAARGCVWQVKHCEVEEELRSAMRSFFPFPCAQESMGEVVELGEVWIDRAVSGSPSPIMRGLLHGRDMSVAGSKQARHREADEDDGQ